MGGDSLAWNWEVSPEQVFRKSSKCLAGVKAKEPKKAIERHQRKPAEKVRESVESQAVGITVKGSLRVPEPGAFLLQLLRLCKLQGFAPRCSPGLLGHCKAPCVATNTVHLKGFNTLIYYFLIIPKYYIRMYNKSGKVFSFFVCVAKSCQSS